MADYAYPKALTGLQDVQWSNMLASIIEDGATTPTAFAPSANGAGMSVSLAPGEAIIRGVLTGDASAATVAISAAPAQGQARIDTIVKRLDRTGTPVIKTAVVRGTAAASPSAPSLTVNPAGIWEWPVADVLVTGGVASIAAEKVTDRRSQVGRNVGSWTTATRPSPSLAALGLNRSSGRWEYHDGSAWRDLVDVGVLPVAKGGTGATGISVALLANLGIVISAAQPAAGTAVLWAKRAA